MPIDKATTEEINSTQHILDNLGKDLIDSLPPLQSLPGAKLKRMVVIWKEILRHRIFDLASASLGLFREERLAPACTLARSCYETVAHLYYFHKQLSKANSAKGIIEIKNLLEKGIFGSKDGSSEVSAIQVLTSIDHVDKLFKGFRGEYDNLCEFAHPNLKGGLGVYAKIDLKDGHVIFGNNPECIPIPAFGLTALNMGLLITIDIFKQFVKTENSFIYLMNYYPDMFLD